MNPRYEIVSILGEGGYGTVYRAWEHTGDFKRQVALKVLKEENPSSDTLQRFADEVKILGLIRDRAIVAVSAPKHLNERWTVVMEFIEGQSICQVINTSGAIPPAAALDIVAEVARCLDHCWSAQGPNGPLHLLHRDIKPQNLQLTQAGEIKLLDFGLAKATIQRTATTTHLIGSPGYIAPERYDQADGQTTDIFSLGVILAEMILGKRLTMTTVSGVDPLPQMNDPVGSKALVLARQMFDANASSRPLPAEVSRQARALAKDVDFDFPAWCKRTVVPYSGTQTSQVVSQSSPSGHTTQPTKRPVVYSTALLTVAAPFFLFSLIILMVVVNRQLTPSPAAATSQLLTVPQSRTTIVSKVPSPSPAFNEVILVEDVERSPEERSPALRSPPVALSPAKVAEPPNNVVAPTSQGPEPQVNTVDLPNNEVNTPSSSSPTAFDVSVFSGKYYGKRAGRNFHMLLQFQEDGGVTGATKAWVGPEVVQNAVSGSWSQTKEGVTITLADNKDSSFTANLTTKRADGQWFVRGRKRGKFTIWR